MLLRCLNQTVVSSCLLLSLAFPSYAVKANADYPVVIQFSNQNDAKNMVQSTYAALVDLNKSFLGLNKYIFHSLSTMEFYQDDAFQDKKAKMTQHLNKQKLVLHVFGKQELNVDYLDPTNNKQYSIQIPALTFSELDLENTQISSIESAREAQNAISAAHHRIQELFIPKENTTSTSTKTQDGLNVLKIKYPESATAILNSLEKIRQFYAKKIHKLKEYADKVASGTYSDKEMEALNTEYMYLVNELYWNVELVGLPINSLKMFKDYELTLQLGNNTTKTYHMPEISLAVLQLDDDSILDFDSAMLSYIDIYVARNWILDWTVTGQKEFSPATDIDKAEIAKLFQAKKQ